MRKLRFILFLITDPFISGTVFSQDTIYPGNEHSFAATVLEITAAEVKYKKTQNINGPVYVVNKDALDSIKYSNGITERFLKTLSINNKPDLQKKPSLILNGGHVYFGDQEFKLNELPDFFDNNTGKEFQELSKKIRTNSRLYKGFQIAAIPTFVVGGVGVVLGGFMYLLSGWTYSAPSSEMFLNTFLGVSSSFLCMGIAFEISSITNKIYQKKRINKAVRLFNSNL